MLANDPLARVRHGVPVLPTAMSWHGDVNTPSSNSPQDSQEAASTHSGAAPLAEESVPRLAKIRSRASQVQAAHGCYEGPLAAATHSTEPRPPNSALTCGNAGQNALLGLALRPRNVPGFARRRPKPYLGQAPDLAVLNCTHTPRGQGVREMLREMESLTGFCEF